jgi:hypothetical protein
MQTPSLVLNIGADVAKDAIVVACVEGTFPVHEIANQRAAVLAFFKDLPAGTRIGVESTGSYHELFAGAAHQLGFLVFLLNPKDTRHYAKAVGVRGKTDRADAELIARMIAHGHLIRLLACCRRPPGTTYRCSLRAGTKRIHDDVQPSPVPRWVLVETPAPAATHELISDDAK